MARTNSQEEPLRDLVRLMIGFLFGSGVAGAAVAMIQETPDTRPWGVAILVLCLLSAGWLFLWSEKVVDRRERWRLQKLGDAYVRALSTTGQRLVDKLETASAEGRLRPSEMRTFVLETLARLLQSQSEQRLGEEEEWVQMFRESTQNTVNEWMGLAAVEHKEGYFPPGAEPEKIS